MNNILAAFNKRFNAGEAKCSLDVIAYRKWLLNGSKGVVPVQLPTDELDASNDWHARYAKLIEEAKHLAASGEQRGGLPFDSLKRRAIALADECFTGPDRGIVFGKVAQAFDAASLPSNTDADDNVRGETEQAKWSSYPFVADHDKFLLLMEIQKYSSWGDNQAENLVSLRDKFRTCYPNDVALMEKAESNGRILWELNEKAYQFGFVRNGAIKFERLMVQAGLPEKVKEQFEKKFTASMEKGRLSKERTSAAKHLIKSVKASSSSQSIQTDKHSLLPTEHSVVVEITPQVGVHPNSILNLHPCSRWTIVTDETGSLFDNEAFDKTSDSGKYVFVLIPENANLPPLNAGWHAVDKGLDQILSVADSLKVSGAGVLGMPVAGLHRTNRNLWMVCVESLLDITLRLLPVEGNTEITLEVEHRGNIGTDDQPLMDAMLDAAMYRLSIVNPDKAANIRLSARFISKGDSKYNGYADAVAYSWGCAKKLRSIFQARCGWVGPCLIDDNPCVVESFHRCLDLVYQRGTLSAEDWNHLVTSRTAMAVGSLVGALLRAYGDEARKDVLKWRVYLDYVLGHLDSKAIKMSVLEPQIAWLKEYEPDDAEIPPRLRLLWLTAQLAAANHKGGTTFGSSDCATEFKELSARLEDEDAPLVCFADLHLAVEKTDSYQFESARGMLTPWESVPIAVPGLRYHAQVLSSLGQHAAFLGENEKAMEYFDRAMSEFKRLSDDWQRDFDHTCAYAVIAAMDSDSSRFQSLMATYLYGGEWNEATMIDMAEQFATVGEDEPDSKYAHAILLRHLVSLPPENLIRQAYVAKSADWKWSEDGHPWELIAFYRALLLSVNDASRIEWLRRGWELAIKGGPTLQVIAAVIGASLVPLGALSGSEYLAKVEEVAGLLPSIGDIRLEALRNQLSSPIPPLELAKIVLPFNFR